MAYRMPLSAGDLPIRHRFFTFKHVDGIQALGHDFGARHLGSDSVWHRRNPASADKTVLTNWVVYDVPFYAMAAGVVVAGWRNAPENVPGLLDAYTGEWFAGGGNHLWILQDDGAYALYAHAKTGSIPADLCPHDAPGFTKKAEGHKSDPDIEPECAIASGARVEAGQFLGRIGNSGNTEHGPHLHVHMEKNGAPVPMNFDHGLTTPLVKDKAPLSGPWTRAAASTLPEREILVWAPRPIGTYTWNGTPAKEFQGLFDHMADSGMMPETITCANNGAIYSSTWVPSSGAWVCNHGMSAADADKKNTELTKQGFTRTSNFTCGPVTVSVWRK